VACVRNALSDTASSNIMTSFFVKAWVTTIATLSSLLMLSSCGLPNFLISKDCDELAEKLLRESFSSASDNGGAYMSSLFVGRAFSPDIYEGRIHAILSTGLLLNARQAETPDYISIWRASEAVTGASVAVDQFPPPWPRVFNNGVPRLHSVNQIICVFPPVAGTSGIIGIENWQGLKWIKNP